EVQMNRRATRRYLLPRSDDAVAAADHRIGRNRGGPTDAADAPGAGNAAYAANPTDAAYATNATDPANAADPAFRRKATHVDLSSDLFRPGAPFTPARPFF